MCLASEKLYSWKLWVRNQSINYALFAYGLFIRISISVWVIAWNKVSEREEIRRDDYPKGGGIEPKSGNNCHQLLWAVRIA
jgi:hypothetical protein